MTRTQVNLQYLAAFLCPLNDEHAACRLCRPVAAAANTAKTAATAAAIAATRRRPNSTGIAHNISLTTALGPEPRMYMCLSLELLMDLGGSGERRRCSNSRNRPSQSIYRRR